MAIIRKMMYEGEQLTPEQIKELDALDGRPVIADDDCPELTSEQLKQMAVLAKQQRAERRRPVITLRVSPATLEKQRQPARDIQGL